MDDVQSAVLRAFHVEFDRLGRLSRPAGGRCANASAPDLQFDVNYTFSKSHGPGIEPGKRRLLLRNHHQHLELRGAKAPFRTTTPRIRLTPTRFINFRSDAGRGYGNDMNKILDAFVGGWQVSTIYRQTSGLPFSASDGSRWATNWEVHSGVVAAWELPTIVDTGRPPASPGPICGRIRRRRSPHSGKRSRVRRQPQQFSRRRTVQYRQRRF